MLIGQDSARPRSLEDLIDPRLAARLESLDVISRKMLSGKLPGERRSKRRGRSVEFDDFRNYTPGDDLRHIDWNVYARFDRLFVKLFREEEDLSLTIALDVSASMDAGTPSKIVFASKLAAALASVGLFNQNRVSLATFGAGPFRMLAPMRGKSNIKKAADFLLESLRINAAHHESQESFAHAATKLASTRRNRGILIVISDWLFDAELTQGLNAFGAATQVGALDTYALMVRSPDERDPTLAQKRGMFGDLLLTDIESGRTAEVTISDASITAYRHQREAFESSWRQACTARGIAPFMLTSDAPVEQVITDSLRKGGLLH
jgi:uncharacterized protein (DUF58 family)